MPVRGAKRKAGASLSAAQKRARGYKGGNIPTLRGQMGSEMKWVDKSVQSAALNGTLAMSRVDPGQNAGGTAEKGCLNGLNTGSGKSERDGRQVIFRGIHVRGTIEWVQQASAASPASSNPVRIIIFKDMFTNGVQTTSAEFMEDTVPDFETFRNLNNSTRYRVLMDKVFHPTTSRGLDDMTGVWAFNGAFATFEYNNRNLNMPCTYRAEGGNEQVSDIADNSLHIIAWTKGNDAGPVNLSYKCRLRFEG